VHDARSVPTQPVRRDPFAPLITSDRAEMMRRHVREGSASHSVPTGGAPQPVTVFDDGRPRVNLGTNNYLGLAGDPQVVEAAIGALRQYGTSAAGSRILNGTTRLHLTLERELAEHYGTEDAVITSAGVNANVALLSTSCGPGDVLMVDAHAHASLHSAATASRGTVLRFTHNSTASLERRLARLDPEAGVVVAVDGVYSMSGESAPLAAIAGLCRRFSARLVVDEAHGLGVLGERGRGAAEAAGVLDRVDAVTIAFSKSLASVGGAVMTSRAVADGIRASAMPYVFSAAGDPAAVAAALASLRVLRREPERMERLRDNGELLRRVLTEHGATPLPGTGAVIAVPTGDDDATRSAWAAAHEAGVYTNAVCYPAVPRGRGVLRLAAMATHTEEQLRLAGELVAEAVRGVRTAEISELAPA
jgi:7-keto-8-aminopelargonate synthetase-like enzyme